MKFSSPEDERWFYEQLYDVDRHFAATKTEEPMSRKYVAGIIKYAERFADLVEKRMAETGKPLRDVAYDASFDADWDDERGVSLFMYGMACEILYRVWAHSAEFCEWHNARWHFNQDPIPENHIISVGRLKTRAGKALIVAVYKDLRGKSVQDLLKMIKQARLMEEA